MTVRNSAGGAVTVHRWDGSSLHGGRTRIATTGAAPNPVDAGVTPGSTLTTHTGDLWLDGDGDTATNLHVTGHLYVTGDNVTVENVLVDGGTDVNRTPGGAFLSPVPSNITLRRLDTTMLTGVGFNGLTVDRCNIHDTEDRANVHLANYAQGGTTYPASDLVITNSWIHGYTITDPGVHMENLHTFGIQGGLVENNLFELFPEAGATTEQLTGNWLMEPKYQGVFHSDFTVRGNTFRGGSYYQIYLSGTGTNVLEDNAFHSDSEIFVGVQYPPASYTADQLPPGGWVTWGGTGNTLDGAPWHQD